MRALRSYLAVLIVGVILPGVAFGLVASWWLAAEMRLNTERQAQRIVEAAAGNVAEHLRLVTAALNVLARSPPLEKGDLAETYRFAASLAVDLGQHIGVATADGQQLFNTRRPFGAKLPPRSHPASYTRALESGRPSVSNVIIGAITKKPLITIDVPVTSSRGPLVLGTSTDVGTIGAVLSRTKLEPGWKAAVVDGEGRFIARTLDPEKFAGQSAAPEVVAIAKSDQQRGAFRDRSSEGDDLFSFFSKIPGTNWMVVIGTPEPLLLAPVRGPLAMLAAAAAAAIGLTLLVALTLGRRLNSAARRLTEEAYALGRGEDPPPPRPSIAEFEQVSLVLREAARLSRERQAELLVAREAAEQSVAAKNRLFAAANHDLRQPLHSSGLCIELLRQITTDPKQRYILEQLELAQASMTNLVGALLDIAKMDADAQIPEAVAVSLANLTAELVTECRPAAEDKGLSLRLRHSPDVMVVTDPALLGRILRNLIHNAIRYTETGGVLVAYRRRGDAVCVEVWDSGIGIPPDRLDLIWEEFYQVGEARQNGAKGLGLGLAIVWRLAKIMGYRVEVRSRPGHGSMFRVVMPDAEAGSPAIR